MVAGDASDRPKKRTLPRDEIADRAGNIFDRHSGIDTMLVEEIDDAGAQPPERGLRDLADALGPAVDAGLPDPEPELRRNNDPVAVRGQALADEFFVREGAVDFGRVEERDPASTAAASSDSIALRSCGGP